MSKTIYVRAAFALAALGASIGEAAALSDWRAVRNAPEIDGPAGIAAIAVLVSAGMMAYHRLRK
jgi:hypothetical protein